MQTQRLQHSSSLARSIHAVTPAVVVIAAIALHAAQRPLPVLTLLTLVSASYGPAIWHEFVVGRGIVGRASIDASADQPPRKRDTILGVEVTK